MTAFAAACLAVAPVTAQTSTARGTLDGMVTDTSLTPLSGAQAWILGTKLEVSTGENGRFRITNIPAGAYVVIVRRLGFAPFSSAMEIAAGDTTRASFTLVPQDVTLRPVVVTAASGVGPLSEFESRRAFGVGQFMTQEDIHRLNMARTSDLLRTFHSATVTPSGVVNSRLLPARGCPYQFYVDGVALSVRDVDTDLPPPGDLAGMEAYANTATVPLQYASVGGGNAGRGGGFCGVILLWTRRER